MAKYLLKPSWIVATARKYKNYQEKRYLGTRGQMWEFHWNPGDKNYTIWAILYRDYTSKNFQAQPWCAMFGTVVVVLTFMEYLGLSTDEAIAATKEFFGGSMPYNCQEFVNEHKNDPRLTHTPAVGCPVIYHTGSKYGHWGACVTTVGSSKKTFSDVEGNTSGGNNKVDPDGGAVVEKSHTVASKTLFWHPEFADENDAVVLETYKVNTGAAGLKVLTAQLTIRTAPGTNSPATGKVYKLGEAIFPTEKTFIDHKPWYHTKDGWIGPNYLEGWVQEECGLWWYMHEGYTYSVNAWEKIGDKWYYFEDTGYMRTNNWVAGSNSSWYFVGEDGAMYESKWVHWNGKDYYLGKDGKMVTDAYKLSADGSIYYYLDENGVWDTSEDMKLPDKDKIVE